MIQELSKNKLNIYSSLSSAKMRKKYSLFAVEGLKSVNDTINHFEPAAVIFTSGHMPSFLNDAMTAHEVSESQMRKISNLTNLPEVVAIYRIPEPKCSFENLPQKLYLVLDGIQDPGNMGTIIRTAHWFGIERIFASNETVDIYNPKTIQSTMGSLAHVTVCYCNLEELFRKNPKFPIFGLLLDGKNIYSSKLGNTGFILMGNEGHGISESLRSKITYPLLIPPVRDNHSESLNVAVATGITLSQFTSRLNRR